MYNWTKSLRSEAAWFYTFLVKTSITKRSYSMIGYKGKQVRDNIHSQDLVSGFGNISKILNMVKYIILEEADFLIAL